MFLGEHINKGGGEVIYAYVHTNTHTLSYAHTHHEGSGEVTYVYVHANTHILMRNRNKLTNNTENTNITNEYHHRHEYN